jgi:hypothetical protein
VARLELMEGSHGGSPERGKRGKGKGMRQGAAGHAAWGAPWGGGVVGAARGSSAPAVFVFCLLYAWCT